MRFTRHTHNNTTSQRQLDLKGTGFPWTAKCSVLPAERRYLKKGCTGFSRPPDRSWAGQKLRQAAERAGSQHVAGGRTGAGGGRRFPQRGPAGRLAGPDGVGGEGGGGA